MGTPTCATCQGMYPACGRCMRRIRIVRTQPQEEQGMRRFIGDDVASRASPLLWPLQAPLARGSALPTPAAHTVLGLTLRAPPVRQGRPARVQRLALW